MIIGIEAEDHDLIISYYDSSGNIRFIIKKLFDHEIFNWVESKKPSLYKNWDGSNIKSEKSQAKWLSRTRLEELMIEKLSDEEKELIGDFHNYPKVDYLDIEILLENDDFPYPDKAEMPVALISFCNEQGVNYVLSIMKSDELPEGLHQEHIEKMEREVNEYFAKVVPHDPSDKKIFDIDFKIKYKFFKTEKELFDFYFDQVLPRKSMITGWNVIDFDWQYLKNRANKLDVDITGSLKYKKSFAKKYKLPTHLGILDYMAFFQDPGYKPYKVVENYTLDYISHRALNTNKLKHPYKTMREFQKDIYLFTMYNVIDNILVKLIEDKFGLLSVAYAFSNIAGVEINKIHSPVHITEVLMSREFLNRGRKMLKKPYSSESIDDTKYEGAYVMAPVPGYYEYISCYDFKSMYPTLQMQFNISPDSFLGRVGMIKPLDTMITTENGTYFDGTKDSVARVILNRLYNARVDAQEEIKQIKYG